MKNHTLFSVSVIFILLIAFGCGEKEPPQVYRKGKTSPLKKDTNLIEVVGLPIYFDSTEYLIHPVGEIQTYDGKASSYVGIKSKGYESSGNLSNIFNVSGNFTQLYFQKSDSEVKKPLTNQYLQIRAFTFLESVDKSIHKKILVYSVSDQDTNDDGTIDSNDSEALYVSYSSGQNFTRLTPPLQELIDWNIINAQHRLYFRTIEDTDKNGKFEKTDKLNHYYIDFDEEEFKVVPYQL